MNFIERHKAKFLDDSGVVRVVKTRTNNEKPADAVIDTTNTEYKVLKALVRSDHQRMKNQPDSVDNHLREKQSLLNRDREYLARWMAAGEKHNNDVLFLNIVWAADVGEWEWLIELVDYSIKTDQSCDIFKSSAESVAAKAVYIAADNARKESGIIPECFFTVFERIKSGAWQISVDMQAKFYKLGGIFAHENGELETAKAYYSKADTLYPNVAVKGRLKEVTELLKN